jgi:hypothetical protein
MLPLWVPQVSVSTPKHTQQGKRAQTQKKKGNQNQKPKTPKIPEKRNEQTSRAPAGIIAYTRTQIPPLSFAKRGRSKTSQN